MWTDKLRVEHFNRCVPATSKNHFRKNKFTVRHGGSSVVVWGNGQLSETDRTMISALKENVCPSVQDTSGQQSCERLITCSHKHLTAAVASKYGTTCLIQMVFFTLIYEIIV